MFQLNTTPMKTEVIASTAPKIGITTQALMKMRAYVQNTHQEIAWMGVVEEVEGEYHITDVMLFEQKVTGTTAEIDEAALSDFGSKLVMSGQVDLYNKIKMWGHSHVNMQVFASGTDEATFRMFYEHNDYFIRLICNKKDEMTLDFMDSLKGVRYLNVPWFEIRTPERIQLDELIALFQKEQNEKYTAITEAAKVEISSNVKAPSYSTYIPGRQYGRVYSGDDYDDYTPTGRDRFVVVDKHGKEIQKKTELSPEERSKKVEEILARDKEKVDKWVEEKEREKKTSQTGDSHKLNVLSLPDITCKCEGACYEVHASEIWNSAEEVYDLMEEVFSAYDLGAKCCMIKEFEGYTHSDWFELYDKLWDWYYDLKFDDPEVE